MHLSAVRCLLVTIGLVTTTSCARQRAEVVLSIDSDVPLTSLNIVPMPLLANGSVPSDISGRSPPYTISFLGPTPTYDRRVQWRIRATAAGVSQQILYVAEASFVPGQSRLLRVLLQRSCAGRLPNTAECAGAADCCPAGQTCSAGLCRTWTHETEPFDATRASSRFAGDSSVLSEDGSLDGATLDGAAVDSTALDGAMLDGAMLDGAGAGESGTDSTSDAPADIQVDAR